MSVAAALLSLNRRSCVCCDPILTSTDASSVTDLRQGVFIVVNNITNNNNATNNTNINTSTSTTTTCPTAILSQHKLQQT